MFKILSKLNLGVVGFGSIAGLIALGIVGANTVYVNEETERAIVINSGEYVKTTGPGMHYKIPFQETYRQYPVSIQRMEIERVSTSTIDNYAIDATIILLYRIPEDKIEAIHRNVPDYEENMEVIATSRFKNELGNIEMAKLADQRAEIEETVNQSLTEEMNRLFDINIVDFTIPFYGWSDAFKEAARREAQAETDLKIARQKAKKAEAESEAKIEAARGDAESKRLATEAEADEIRMKGEAEADALQAQAQALANNPQLVELEKAKKWNGELPTNMYGQAPIPFFNSEGSN